MLQLRKYFCWISRLWESVITKMCLSFIRYHSSGFRRTYNIMLYHYKCFYIAIQRGTILIWQLISKIFAIETQQLTIEGTNLRCISWWRHQIEAFSELLDICAGNSPVLGAFPAQGPVTPSFDVFLDLRLNKRLIKQWWSWRFETPSRPLWFHCNVCELKVWSAYYIPHEIAFVINALDVTGL